MCQSWAKAVPLQTTFIDTMPRRSIMCGLVLARCWEGLQSVFPSHLLTDTLRRFFTTTTRLDAMWFYWSVPRRTEIT
jgi:hypothetical protein